MKTPTFKTKCTVRLQKSPTNEKDYYLFSRHTLYLKANTASQKYLNRIVSSVVWDTKRATRGGNYQPKRNVEGVIQCRSKADQQSAIFAAQVCATMQDEYNKKALFPEQYKEHPQIPNIPKIPTMGKWGFLKSNSPPNPHTPHRPKSPYTPFRLSNNNRRHLHLSTAVFR